MGKSTISMAIFNSKLLVYQAGYGMIMENFPSFVSSNMARSEILEVRPMEVIFRSENHGYQWVVSGNDYYIAMEAMAHRKFVDLPNLKVVIFHN